MLERLKLDLSDCLISSVVYVRAGTNHDLRRAPDGSYTGEHTRMNFQVCTSGNWYYVCQFRRISEDVMTLCAVHSIFGAVVLLRNLFI